MEEKSEGKEKNNNKNRIDNNFYVETIAGDGHCMFKTISLRVTGTVNLYQEFRKICFIEIWKKLDRYKDFLENNNHLEYLKKLLYSNEWGGSIELQAIANVLNANINIYTGEMIRGTREIKVKGLTLRNKINNSYGKSTNLNHYSLLVKKDEPQEAIEKIRKKWIKTKENIEKEFDSIEEEVLKAIQEYKKKGEIKTFNIKKKNKRKFYIDAITPMSKNIEEPDNKDLKDYYTPNKLNSQEELKNKTNFEEFTEQKVIKFDEIKGQIKNLNPNNNECKKFLETHKNIIFVDFEDKSAGVNKTSILTKEYGINELLRDSIP